MDIMFVCSSNRLCFENLLLCLERQRLLSAGRLYLSAIVLANITHISKTWRFSHDLSSDSTSRSNAEPQTIGHVLTSKKRLLVDRMYRRKGSGKSRSVEFHLWGGSAVRVFRVTDHLTRRGRERERESDRSAGFTSLLDIHKHSLTH